ncbi:LysM domain-containing protein [Podospora aff. communis PSN243]|uniref:LysM domain-containing protein n=1 Tax=Podospora aff. communis PSN243 TaxID=3040156 RepID=A0AAV9GYD7_9PEZI|nr:LysM domain-containing protein [Podospora aff. communis PSN243]
MQRLGLYALAALLAGLVGLSQAQTASTPPGPTFTGSPSNCNKWYVIATGDTCTTVEAKFSITHQQFISWNPAVSNNCLTNFWVGQAYCVGLGPSATPSATRTTSTSRSGSSSSLPGATTPPGPTFTGSPSNCNRWYLIAQGDTCATVEAKFGITHQQFISWNPAVSNDCQTNFWLGQAYCVGLGPLVSSTTSRSSSTSLFSNTTISITRSFSSTPYSTRHPITNQTIVLPTQGTEWPPTKTQAGQPSYCNSWHYVAPGETCEGIVAQYATWMSKADFLAWNPEVGVDCSGMYVYHWVCVGIQPQTQISLPYITANATVSIPPYFSFTPAPIPSEPIVWKPTPTAGTLPANCRAFVQAGNGDTCRTILAEYTFIMQTQFFSWHPFLNSNCDGLWSGYWYCVMAFEWNELPMPPTVTTTPSPVQTGIVSACRAWFQSPIEGPESCTTIAAMFGTFSEANFKQWNPAVGSDCADLEADTWYCVRVPGTPTTRTAPPPEPTVPTERPTQPGIAPNCGEFWLVSRSDTCASIAASERISIADFLAWNPAVGSGTTCSGLKPDFYVCVGLSGSSSTTSRTSLPPSGTTTSSRISSTTSRASSTSSAPTGVVTPQPVQDGMVRGCKKFYLVKQGDGCWAIANAHGIALADFYTWNPAMNNGGECWGLWPDYYVCVGI